MQSAYQNTTKFSGVRRVSLSWQLCLCFGIVATVVTVESRLNFSAREQAQHNARAQSLNDKIIQTLSQMTKEVLSDGRSADLQHVLHGIGEADRNIVRLIVMGVDSDFLLSWHSRLSLGRRQAVVSLNKVFIGS